MKTSKKQKIHVWKTLVDVPEPVVYRCTKCLWETKPGVPLPLPYKEECPDGGKKL